jgi:hypothetical protein
MAGTRDRRSPLMIGVLAQEILYRGQIDLERHGIAYRAGKTRRDVERAMGKLNRDEKGRLFEGELDLFEISLRGIFEVAETV